MGKFLIIFGAVTACIHAETYQMTGRVIYAGHSAFTDWHGTNQMITGQVTWNRETKQASGVVTVDLAEWNSSNDVRDNHTHGMFEATKFARATLTFQGLPVAAGAKTLDLTGALDLHGVKRPFTIPGTLQQDGKKIRFEGKGVMKLSDWQLPAPRLLGIVVADEVQVEFYGEGVAQ